MSHTPSQYFDLIEKRRENLVKVSPLGIRPKLNDKNKYIKSGRFEFPDEFLHNFFGYYGNNKFARASFEAEVDIKFFKSRSLAKTTENFEKFRLIVSNQNSCRFRGTFVEVELERNKFGKIFPIFYDLCALDLASYYDCSFESKEEFLDEFKDDDLLELSDDFLPLKSKEFLKLYYEYKSIIECPIQYVFEFVNFYKLNKIKDEKIPLIGKVEFDLGT